MSNAAVRPWLERLRDRWDDRRARTPVLIGHSHARAVFEAAEAAHVSLKGFNFWTAPQPALNPDRTAFHPEIAAVLARGPVFSAVGGAVHSMIGMVRHPRAFDFVLPSHPDLPVADGAELLPFEAVRRAMAEMLDEYLQITLLVRRAATGRVFQLEAPPPLEDGVRVEADVPWMFFPDLTREVAPAGLRYKCWRLHSELVAAFCAEHDIAFVPAPRDAITARGFLDPRCYLDAMHVNERYGALVLAQIRENS